MLQYGKYVCMPENHIKSGKLLFAVIVRACVENQDLNILY